MGKDCEPRGPPGLLVQVGNRQQNAKEKERPEEPVRQTMDGKANTTK
jgi:hypothetical protein